MERSRFSQGGTRGKSVDFAPVRTKHRRSSPLAHANVTQTYQEDNTFNNSSTIPVGQDGLRDFVLVDVSAPGDTNYYLRLIRSAGTVLSSYGIVAQLTTSTPNAVPAAPTLSSPSASAIGVSVTPQFQFRTTDADSDYLRYKIEVCSTSDCSVIVRTIDQTASQTGWSGQDTQTGTAYVGSSTITSSTMAAHTYQAAALSYSTQYWWRVQAIDPGGSNSWSSHSTTGTFSTESSRHTIIDGGVRLTGGTVIGQ